jgi:small-conductance mechanosensitive channel
VALPAFNITTDPIYTTIVIAIAIAVTFLLFEGIGRLLSRIAVHAGGSALMVRRVKDTLRLLGLAVAVYVGLAASQLLSVLSLLTISGIIGLIISLALQSTLTNVIAGVFLLRDHALVQGDSITFSGVTGKVLRITFRNVWMLTAQGEVAVVSNSNLYGGPFVNHSMKDRVRDEFPLMEPGMAPQPSPPGASP